MTDYVLHELAACDWSDYRAIRLRSLQDSPDSFASLFEREVQFSTEQWQARLGLSPSMLDAVAVAAVADESYVGLVSSIIDSSDPHTAHLFQMWVDPDHRGEGVGRALVQHIIQWAVNRHVGSLQLSVTQTNLQAIALYQSLGFAPEGALEPLRAGSFLQCQPMTLRL